MKSKKYLLAGVTGGIASGKSLVSDALKKFGAYIIDADIIAREIVKPDMPAWTDIKTGFGNNILNDDRSINRGLLGKIIFNDPDKKRLLEEITHPRIISEQNRIIGELKKNDYKGIIVIDAALLIESGYYREMDIVVVVCADREIQLKRLMQRDHISVKEAEKKINAQMPLDSKKGFADFIIYNNDSSEDTKRQVKKMYRELMKFIGYS